MKVQAAGGHQNLTVYVLMNTADSTSDPPVSYPPGYEPGKIYKGRVDSRQPGSGLILTWFPASGSSTNPLGQADDFFVNPYDPNELYAVDVQHQRIMHSVDGGGNWLMEPTLKDIATNHGEYRIGCNGSRGGLHAPSPFSNSCSLSSMFFDPFAPNIRVAAMLYGGIAFSRDKGKDWMALDVTDNNHFLSNNLTEPVVSVIYDGETQLPDVTYSANVIYAGLMGKSLKRVEGPFQILESLNFSYQSASASKISVVIATLGQTVRLRKYSDNVFRGSALFNYSTLPLSQEVEYYFLNDGIATATYKWTVDTTSGVSNTPLAH
jgi:hypothetical protein